MFEIQQILSITVNVNKTVYSVKRRNFTKILFKTHTQKNRQIKCNEIKSEIKYESLYLFYLNFMHMMKH